MFSGSVIVGLWLITNMVAVNKSVEQTEKVNIPENEIQGGTWAQLPILIQLIKW